MKHPVFAAVLSLFGLLGLSAAGAVQAAAIDLGNVAAPHPVRAAPPLAVFSELPEPEVFAMMLVGLVLIGYRASRRRGEKFE